MSTSRRRRGTIAHMPLPRSLLRRADVLVAWFGERQFWIRRRSDGASRSDVLREAIARGLESLEHERDDLL